MIYKVFSIYDSKAEAYLQPFMMKTKGEAIRAITARVNDGSKENSFYHHAGDFTLFEVGTWNDENAFFTQLSTPHSMGVLIEFKKDVSS